MRSIRKKGQSVSLDVYMGVAIFLVAFIIFFGFIAKKTVDKDINTETKDVSDRVMADPYFEDMYITSDEENALVNMTCENLTRKYNTANKLCIYFVDANGDIVPINSSKYGIGCPGINISGVPCGEAIPIN